MLFSDWDLQGFTMIFFCKAKGIRKIVLQIKIK